MLASSAALLSVKLRSLSQQSSSSDEAATTPGHCSSYRGSKMHDNFEMQKMQSFKGF
jgi:hypothetical protein